MISLADVPAAKLSLQSILFIAVFALIGAGGLLAGFVCRRLDEVEANRRALRTGKWHEILARRPE